MPALTKQYRIFKTTDELISKLKLPTLNRDNYSIQFVDPLPSGELALHGLRSKIQAEEVAQSFFWQEDIITNMRVSNNMKGKRYG